MNLRLASLIFPLLCFFSAGAASEAVSATQRFIAEGREIESWLNHAITSDTEHSTAEVLEKVLTPAVTKEINDWLAAYKTIKNLKPLKKSFGENVLWNISSALSVIDPFHERAMLVESFSSAVKSCASEHAPSQVKTPVPLTATIGLRNRKMKS